MALFRSSVCVTTRLLSPSPRVCTDGVRSLARSYGDVITKFSRLDELPNLLRNGAPSLRPFGPPELRYKSPGSYSLPSLWKICKRISPLSPFDQATWQHPRESPRHVRGSARKYDVRMAQFVLKIEKLSHIIGARGSQGLRSLSPIMAPGQY